MVEAQRLASTSKIVDTMSEQAVLEDILEESEPPIPKEALDLHFLLFSPFRYEPRKPIGSRFRAVYDPGVFYAAETVRTAAAEVSYWRWQFLQDTSGLKRLQPCSFTAFKTAIKTNCIDLREPPFEQESDLWQHPTNYSATQALGRIARDAGIGAIQYQSVRDPERHFCVAVLTPLAFATKKPERETQTWILAISTEEAIWMRQGDESFSFETCVWR